MTDSLADRPAARVAALLAASGVDSEVLHRLLGPGSAHDELMRGTRLPTLDEATVLGAYLAVPPSVLLGRASAPIGVSLRLGALEGVEDVAEVVGHAAKLLEADRVTSNWGLRIASRSLDGFALALDTHAMTAGKKAANRLRAFLDIGSQDPIEDLAGLVESLGHPVEHRLMPDQVHGLAVQEKRGESSAWVVLVNAGDQWGRQRYTLAHELCHVLYGDEGQVIIERADPGDKLVELRAESFARHLLLPEPGVRSFVEKHGPVRGVVAAARLVADACLYFGASKQATLNALRGHIAEPLHSQCDGMGAGALMELAGRRDEWKELGRAYARDVPSTRLTTQVLSAFSQSLVGIGTVADVITCGDVQAAVQKLERSGWTNIMETQGAG